MADTDELPGEDAGDGEEIGEGGPIRVEPDDPWASERLNIEAVWHLVSTRFEDPYANHGVQVAYERMLIAAYERIARFCRADLPADEP